MNTSFEFTIDTHIPLPVARPTPRPVVPPLGAPLDKLGVGHSVRVPLPPDVPEKTALRSLYTSVGCYGRRAGKGMRFVVKADGEGFARIWRRK